MLWRDGIIVSTARAPASLDPTEVVPTNTTTRETGLEVGDFAEEEERTPVAEPQSTGRPVTESAGPGFGVGAAVVALVGAGLLTRRRSA